MTTTEAVANLKDRLGDVLDAVKAELGGIGEWVRENAWILADIVKLALVLAVLFIVLGLIMGCTTHASVVPEGTCLVSRTQGDALVTFPVPCGVGPSGTGV